MFLELKKPQICKDSSIEDQIRCINALENGIKMLSSYDSKKTENWKLNEIIWYNYDMNVEEGYGDIANKHLEKCERTFQQNGIRTEYYKIEEEYERVRNPYYIDSGNYCPLAKMSPLYTDMWTNKINRTLLTQCVSGQSCYMFYDNCVPTSQLKHYIESGELVLFKQSGVTSSTYRSQIPPLHNFHYPDSDFNSLLLCNCKLSMSTDSLGPYKDTFLSLFKNFLTKEQIEKDIKTMQQWIKEISVNIKITAKSELNRLDKEKEKIKNQKNKIKSKLN